MFPNLTVFFPFLPVFPTRVGVFPAILTMPKCQKGFPHASGGVSNGGQFSPREWGCFSARQPGTASA